MGKFIPNAINCGYLTVPTFLAEDLAKLYHADIADDLLEPFDSPSLKEPFSELRFVNETETTPAIVRLLTDSQIPFHYNLTLYEGVEVEYWYMLDNSSSKNICGFNLMDSPKEMFTTDHIDYDYVNSIVGQIKAQHRLLDSTIDHLLEVRNMHEYNFDQHRP